MADAPLDWHNASDHRTLDGLLACPLHHREFLPGTAIPLAPPSCEDWPECALDDDRCAAVAVMGRGTCPRIPPGGPDA